MRLKRGRAGTVNRFMAALLAAAMVGYWVPADIFGADAPVRLAEIQGSILAADGLTTIPGVSVKAANLKTREIYTSNPTAEDGVYKLSDLPEGTYDLAVETGQGLYVADVLIEATPSRPVLVSLALTPRSPAEGDEEQPAEEDEAEVNGEEDEETTPAEEPEPQPKKKKKKGGGFWRSPTGAAITIVVGAGLVGAAANSVADDSSTNSITPSN